MAQELTIPRYIDDPPQVLLWSIDEFAPMAIGMVVGMMVGHLGICLLGGIVMAHYYKKFRDGQADGLALHWLYWNGVPQWMLMGWGKKSYLLPDSYDREFVP